MTNLHVVCLLVDRHVQDIEASTVICTSPILCSGQFNRDNYLDILLIAASCALSPFATSYSYRSFDVAAVVATFSCLLLRGSASQTHHQVSHPPLATEKGQCLSYTPYYVITPCCAKIFVVLQNKAKYRSGKKLLSIATRRIDYILIFKYFLQLQHTTCTV